MRVCLGFLPLAAVGESLPGQCVAMQQWPVGTVGQPAMFQRADFNRIALGALADLWIFPCHFARVSCCTGPAHTRARQVVGTLNAGDRREMQNSA